MEACKCPVCNGRGFVPNGFYSTTNESWYSSSTAPETCRTCNGSGMVWYGNDEYDLYMKNE